MTYAGNQGVMVSLFTWWTCDVELDCSSMALLHWLHRMQDMCN
ncbi:hypothetical protein MA3A0930S_2652 [Mycobacteroides abscessus 3A-0930-S]|nr:hypothetical protein MA3A0119R_2624 [Mycobacteroides abscessus 3A-0119-R]EIV29584.1 hypothetical protein MA3A0122R_2687 [Mycobacteroides abscessus 3A-0122-R]EIV36369.1 hypothetical protein MA3A0122S_2241 [Mycobacteroides abscessus 3A-0122-S]EIV38572.1 hypothetical protein MA3A0731_2782 [Mycobacteroides abscessus 3A-0731]EIV53447.1 hypothetical protein MA3A0930S_2652 [Mycobacteroides abscessus 3A-0930-S]EIV54496.1 hypothetical protein MA3A0930R_2724 [Mycobacteroides abscessus 3A-0930-R]EIV7